MDRLPISFSCSHLNCSTTKTPQQQVEFFVKKYFAPLAEKRKKRNLEDEIFILEPTVQVFSPPLKECFMFFATIATDYEKQTLKRHESRSDINAMTQSLHFGGEGAVVFVFVTMYIGASFLRNGDRFRLQRRVVEPLQPVQPQQQHRSSSQGLDSWPTCRGIHGQRQGR